MKTITELNGKWWYRMLKVISIFVLLLIVVLGGFLNFSNIVDELDQEKTTVTCNNNSLKTSISTFNKSYSYYDLYAIQNNSLNADLAYEIKGFCMQSVVEMKDGTKKLISYREVMDISDLSNVDNIDGHPLNYEQAKPRIPLEYIFSTPEKNNFTLEIVTKNNLGDLLSSYLIFLVMCFVIFEFIRRSFYYVILGTIRPNK